MRALLLVLALLAAGCATPAPEPSSASPSEPAPSVPDASPTATPSPEAAEPVWSFTDVTGTTYTSESPKSDATMFFFMATWCSSCRQKAPLVAAVASEYADRGLATYSLDFDPSESPADIRAWQERYGHSWPHGLDEGLRLQRQFDVRVQSTILVLDGEGKVVQRFGYGSTSGDAVRSAVETALSRASSPTSA